MEKENESASELDKAATLKQAIEDISQYSSDFDFGTLSSKTQISILNSFAILFETNHFQFDVDNKNALFIIELEKLDGIHELAVPILEELATEIANAQLVDVEDLNDLYSLTLTQAETKDCYYISGETSKHCEEILTVPFELDLLDLDKEVKDFIDNHVVQYSKDHVKPKLYLTSDLILLDTSILNKITQYLKNKVKTYNIDIDNDVYFDELRNQLENQTSIAESDYFEITHYDECEYYIFNNKGTYYELELFINVYYTYDESFSTNLY